MPPAVTRKRHAELLSAAAGLFSARGYASATVRDVAFELGLNNGSLYHYVAGKEDLLFQLLARSRDGARAILDEVATAPGLTPLERLDRYVRRQVAFMLEEFAMATIYCRDVERLSEPRRREIIRAHNEHERWLVGVIDAARAAGELPDALDPRAHSRCVFAVILSAHGFYRPGRDDPEVVAATCAALALGPAGASSATS